MESSNPPWRILDAPSAQPADGNRGSGGTPAPGLTIQPLALAAVVAAILIGAVAVAIALGGAGGTVAGPNSTGLAGTDSATRVAEDGLLVVDIAGAVVAPGVYRLAPGSRVGEAIDAAGGFSPRVDAGRVALELNLAATVSDGQQIRVPSRDDPAGGGGGGGSGSGSGAGGAGGLIDLNAATQAELESLPGIGPVTAGKIIAARAETPFGSIEDLRDRGLVGEKTFDSIRALITVG